MPKPNPPASTSRVCVLITVWIALIPLLLQIPHLLSLGIVLIALAVNTLTWRKALWRPLQILLMLTMLGLVSWQMEIRFDRDTGCAVLAAMLAIKTSELHSLRDARSLLGFALFSPFAAFLLDQGALTMVLALLVVPAALLSMHYLAQDQSQVSSLPLRSQLFNAGKLTLLGVPLALGAFWLLPRLEAPLWGIPERALTHPGLSDKMSPDTWIDLMNDDTTAMRVSFNGPTPPPQQRYWRGPVMWDFDGRSWQATSHLDLTPPPPFLPRAPHFDYRVDYEPTDRPYLVALDLPLAAPVGTRLSMERSLLANHPLTAITRWQLQSASPASFQGTLTETQHKRALALPAGFNPRTVALGQQWRQEAGTDDAAIVQRALNWVHSEFTYTLATIALPGRDTVDEFLFRSKSGFCEHFSSSFVVLMRASGIPARVVTGYVGGVYNPLGHYWVIRRMDAHAWAEIWLPQRGWVRIDPTSAVAPERIQDTLEDRLGQNNIVTRIGGEWRFGDIGDWLRSSWNDLVLGFDANRQQQLLRPFGIKHLRLSQLTMLFIAFASVALCWMFWWLARGEQTHDPLLRAWHRLGRRYARLGLGRVPHEPALVWARRIEQQYPSIGLYTLSQRFTDARYNRRRIDRMLIHALLHHRPHTPEQRKLRTHLFFPFISLLALASCATMPKPLQGQFSAITPRDSVTNAQVGNLVRWGGKIIKTIPGQGQTCFEMISRELDSSGRPNNDSEDTNGGRFIACHSGFYDPAVFEPGREVTFIGKIESYENTRIGEYDYKLPKVAANVIYLWPVIREVDVVPVYPYNPWGPPGPWGWGHYRWW